MKRRVFSVLSNEWPWVRSSLSALHIYQSPFKNESRILKETKSLAQTGAFKKIQILAIWEEGLAEYENLDSLRSVWRVKLWLRRLSKSRMSKALSLLEWFLRIIWAARKRKIDFVQVHSLLTLPLGSILKVWKGSKLIYDAHELETESKSLSRISKKLAKILEATFIGFADSVIVVSESIKKWYVNRYPKSQIHLIKNIPEISPSLSNTKGQLRGPLNIPEEALLFIYQGLLGRGRGIEMLLDVFERQPPSKHIVFMGYGPLEEEIRAKAAKKTNIHFHPAVKPSEIPAYTQDADVGLSLIEDLCLSYRYSLPNKIYEYVTCGVPVVVSDFPDMGAFVDEHQCGWKCRVEALALETLVNQLSTREIVAIKDRLKQKPLKFDWKEEGQKLLRIYGLSSPSKA